jgi:serine/threonine protein kinase
MEYISLGSLLAWMEQFPRISVLIGEANISKLLGVIYSLLECTVYLHGLDIIHCDIKPANILLLNASRVKLADLGESIPIASSSAIGTLTKKEMTLKEAKGKLCRHPSCCHFFCFFFFLKRGSIFLSLHSYCSSFLSFAC